ncbi:DNA (cytosine-5-)-methyltransferase [Bacillus cereus]|uniref:DNA cytosine methyltransferase n=1 Tax=Bacillus cereus TaxID=1396 RepID=UPI000BFA08B9|nr:DNA cytosine methyltransferase [Bacillus cereus]PFT53839.1 DNA (cytosine-5-)-methyltransferase [Bacillus cereus]
MTNNTFKYVSLFSGVGGFEQALNRLGGKCVMSSEIDKFANQAYEVLYGHKTVGDVTKVATGDVPNHDWLVAGFPCPTFSVAGGRDGMEYQCKNCGHEHLITYEEYKNGVSCPVCKGITEPKDDRGLLFFEIARIAEAKQPRLLLLENVKGLISSAKGKRRISTLEGVKTFNFDWPAQDTVTTRLRDILEDEVDERYYLSEEKTAKLVAQLESKGEPLIQKDVKMIGHADIAGHDFNRRIYSVNGVSWTLNTASDIGRSVKVAEPQVVYHDLTQTVVLRKHKVNIEGLRTLLRECKKKTELTNKQLAEHFERPVTEVEHWFRTDKCFSIPSADIWEELKWILEIPTNEFDAQVTEFIEKEGVFEKAGRFYEVDGLAPTLTRTSADEKIIEPQMIGHVDIKGHDAIKRVYSTEGISPTLTTMGGGHREPKIAEVRACLTPDREEKRQQGRRFKENDEPSHTINTQDRHGVAIGKYPKYRIRKLTPKECFRLQGFSDSEFDKLVGAGISNSQLYKMAGNAVTVNVIEAIGSRLLKYLAHNELGSRYVEVTEKGA